MKTAKTTEELIQRFISKADNAEATVQIGEFLNEVRHLIEKDGRIAELKRMVEYHQYMINLIDDDAEKHVHAADIVVLQQRIHYLEGNTSA